MAGAALVALAAIASGASRPAAVAPADERPNVIIVVTDDQRWDTLDAMPWLQGQLARPGSGWGAFRDAFANTPLCCPARASLLTGRYARHTGVLRNDDADRLDESSTLATWLHDAGYRTALVGKYLNGYPFGDVPYVPRGWDVFVAKRNRSEGTVYRDFDVVDQGSPVHVGDAYATDWLADRAVSFIRATSPTRPFFLVYAPSAPHSPWLPAPRDEGALAERAIEESPSVAGALRGAPPWVRSLPLPSAAQRTEWIEDRRRADETMLAVDDALRALVGALGDRLDDTAIFLLSDHGYSFGEHRWEGKKCPYDECVRIPLVVHSPSGSVDTRRAIVSTVDVAPTVLSLARVAQPGSMDGEGFAARIEPYWGVLTRPPEGVYLEWAGDARIPAWAAVRTRDLKLIRYGDGSEELYDIGGRVGPPDPWETVNRVRDPRYAGLLEHLRALLGRHLGPR